MSQNRCTIAVIFLLLGSLAFANETSPYGVCAHVSRHGDHELAAAEFALMRRAGIGWARTDFDWTTVQPREGQWDFSMLDATVDQAQHAGITILPILAYDVPWASPAYKHLDAWLEYVRRTVGRYQDRLRYWEVWNEQDLESFWRDTPDPAAYTTLLKATYAEIKKIDPELQVLVGGMSGIPLAYIEGIYQAGGGDFFDLMAVHPYRYPHPPEAQSLAEDLRELRELMARYGDADKPIWITEIGWPTHQNQTQLLEQIVRTGLATVEPERGNWTLGVLKDGPAPMPFSDEQLTAMLPGGGRVQRLDWQQVQHLTAETVDALLMAPTESFAVDAFDAIEAYVRSGGTVIFAQGVPLYYAARQSDDGSWTQQGADESYRRRLHIGWQAWWTKDGVPKTADVMQVPEAMRSGIRLDEHTRPAERFLTDAALKPGDRFIPLLQASKDGFTGTPAAVFDLDSDLKGAVIVSTLIPDYRGITEAQQAAVLPRAYLIALHAGVERVFWYNLRARENDPYYNEDHFGILHQDLAPKPAYLAMQVLNRARPSGSVPLDTDWQTGSLFHPGWKRPDGQTAYALWTRGTGQQATVTFDGTVAEASDHLGNAVSIPNNSTIRLSEDPVYLIGPVTLKINSPR